MMKKLALWVFCIFLVMVGMPMVQATLQNETLACFQGFNAQGQWIDHVNGSNATPKGGAGNVSDGCPFGFSQCAHLPEGIESYFNISSDLLQKIINLQEGGILSAYNASVGGDAIGALLSVSQRGNDERATFYITGTQPVNMKHVFDIQPQSGTLNRTCPQTGEGFASGAGAPNHMLFQSSGTYYSSFSNGSNRTLIDACGGINNGAFFGDDNGANPRYDTAVIGLSLWAGLPSTYNLRARIPIYLILNKSINAEKYNETWNNGNPKNCSQILGQNDDVDPPSIRSSFNNTNPKKFEFLNISANITDSSGILSANMTINLSTGTVKINFTVSGTSAFINNITQINESRGNVLNITIYSTDTASRIHINSTIITIDNSLPIPLNISITPVILQVGDTAKGHANYSDPDGDNAGANQTYWWVNKTLILEANNSFTLGSGNLTLESNITFSARFNDTNGSFLGNFSNWVNSSTLTVGDTSLPTINGAGWSVTQITNGDRINITINASDNNLLLQINMTIRSPTGIIINRSCLNINQYSFICNTTFFDGDETAENGVWNITVASALDSSFNLIYSYPNATMTTNLPSGGGSPSGGGGGGGGGTTCQIGFALNESGVCVNNTKIILKVENCNFNKICEGNLGEDALGCSTDCKLSTNFFTCDDPTQPCIRNAINRLFTERSKVLNLSIIIGIIALTIVLIPINSPIGRYIKKPLFRRKT